MKSNIIISLLLIFTFYHGYSQVGIKIDVNCIAVGDTLTVKVDNKAKKSVAYYYVGWEIYEEGKWRVMKPDLWNDIPMTEKWEKINASKVYQRKFEITNIFSGTFKKYTKMLGRLVLTYSYSSELEPKQVVYSPQFIVKVKW